MSVSKLVNNLSLERRSLLCELLIEIILDSNKDPLSNELVLNILAMWKDKQLITINNTLRLIKTAHETNPEATHMLLTKMGITSFSETIELGALKG